MYMQNTVNTPLTSFSKGGSVDGIFAFSYLYIYIYKSYFAFLALIIIKWTVKFTNQY